MNKKIISIICIMLFSIIILNGCNKSNVVQTTNTEVEQLVDPVKPVKDYISILNNAKTIRIQEGVFSIGKHYDIEVDGEVVATVEGKFLNGFGDTFTLKDKDGKFLVKESQIKRWGFKSTRGAVIKDAKDNTLGYIGEEIFDKLFSIGYVFHFYDKNEKEIGKSDQLNFKLFKEYKYYDMDENTDYLVKENLDLIKNSFTITIKDKKEIPLYNAILMVCIQDAIYDSKNKKK